MARRRSNTVGNKLKDEEAMQQKTLQSLILTEPSLIKITTRRTDKPSRIIQITSMIRGQKLFELIQKQFYIDRENQILFIRGERILANPQQLRKTFHFESRDIIHVHNADNINRGVIGISLAILNSELVKYNQIKITVNCKQVIRNALEDVLMYQLEDFERYVYVQSGRLIDLRKSFEQEAVENDTIILVTDCTDDDKILNRLQIREIELIQYNKKLLKKPSLNMEQCMLAPNFKKKQKYYVYKSMFVPESKEIIWEEESNSSFSKKMLIKKLLKKRSKKQKNQLYKQNRLKTYQKLNANNEKQLPSIFLRQDTQAKTEVKEGKRLILSECFPPKKQNNQELKALKPPPKIADDFFDQTEEMQFGEQEEKVVEIEEKRSPLKMSAPLNSLENSLKCSIGKLKGVFVPIISKNIDMDDDDDDDDD